MTKPLEIESISITRVEGRADLCGITHTFKTLKEAQKHLLCYQSTYGEGGGYDKHDLDVVFMGGGTERIKYHGRLDCKSAKKPDNDLNITEYITSAKTKIEERRLNMLEIEINNHLQCDLESEIGSTLYVALIDFIWQKIFDQDRR